MSIWASANKSDRRKIKAQMLVHANNALRGLYPVAAQRHAAARVLVDQALAKENSQDERKQDSATL